MIKKLNPYLQEKRNQAGMKAIGGGCCGAGKERKDEPGRCKDGNII